MNPSDQWFTPVDVLEAVEKFFDGFIDFDPTCSPQSPAWDKVLVRFTEEDDCLVTPWPSERAIRSVFINCPYSSPAEFIDRFLDYLFEENVHAKGITLTNAATSTQWCQTLLRHGDFACFVSPRIRFYRARRSVRDLCDAEGYASTYALNAYEYLRSIEAGINQGDLTKAEKKFLATVDAEAALEIVYTASDGTQLVQPGSPRYENLIVGFGGTYEEFTAAFGSFGVCVRLGGCDE